MMTGNKKARGPHLLLASVSLQFYTSCLGHHETTMTTQLAPDLTAEEKAMIVKDVGRALNGEGILAKRADRLADKMEG